jgi:hypothetical protein
MLFSLLVPKEIAIMATEDPAGGAGIAGRAESPALPSATETSDAQWVTYQVRLRPEHAARLRAYAAREGASPEALAALWLEEKLDEATRSSS